jgi:hypothetical protein
MVRNQIEFKTGSSNTSDLLQILFTILNAVKEQGFDAHKFSIEIDTE